MADPKGGSESQGQLRQRRREREKKKGDEKATRSMGSCKIVDEYLKFVLSRPEKAQAMAGAGKRLAHGR